MVRCSFSHKAVKQHELQAAAKEDVLLRSLSQLGEVAVLAVDGTNLVADAKRRHSTAPTATAALGRTLMGALLMASFRKDDEAVQVSFKGDGVLGGVFAIADTRGHVKGKVGNSNADPPLRPDGKLAVGDAVGEGVLSVVRSHPLQPQPYTGMVKIVSGEIAEDLATYMAESEQTNSALALGVAINRDCSVNAAGGYLVQVLPFCSEETLEQLEKNLSSLPSVTKLLQSGATPQDITDRILDGIGTAGAPLAITPKYGPCEADALKDRMKRAVASLGPKEVRSIIEEQGKIEVRCELCNEAYHFTEEEVLDYV
ncbi:putative chaperonin [Monoraphidium neglectum]|uniref:Putative chaperonin n=1 Tax=Monoraphidium neglectum TaxID=145388 RepID=A0A0D2L2H5_9CHLO|nr:putative chaperonin [Monoraphidium neglectum]KIZ01469.1 putative chaperonin [Monoraphidium neglectum]|eukprot:XP_013900488.1 putative chaperonin [Monoraphidium neglectum]